MAIIEQAVDAVKNFMGIGQEEEPTVRERILAPSLTEPAPEPQEVSLETLEDYEQPEDFGGIVNQFPEPGVGNVDLGNAQDFDLRTEEELLSEDKAKERDAEAGMKGIESKSLGLETTESKAKIEHLDTVKAWENPAEKGLIKGPMTEKFMMFESTEGVGPTTGMSKFEIGYGIKIPKSWLSTNPNKWPTIDGVRTDIKKGIAKDQAESLSKKSLDKAYKSSKMKLTKWEDMTNKEKAFWGDLTYNGGGQAINKNPKAKKAANEGNTVEGMVLALDFIRSAGKPERGLLNRRLSMYNQAALEVSGAPVVEEYKFGKEIKIKFSSDFMTDKVSKPFAKKVNGKDGWITIAKGGGEETTRKVGKNYKFEG